MKTIARILVAATLLVGLGAFSTAVPTGHAAAPQAHSARTHLADPTQRGLTWYCNCGIGTFATARAYINPTSAAVSGYYLVTAYDQQDNPHQYQVRPFSWPAGACNNSCENGMVYNVQAGWYVWSVALYATSDGHLIDVFCGHF